MFHHHQTNCLRSRTHPSVTWSTVQLWMAVAQARQPGAAEQLPLTCVLLGMTTGSLVIMHSDCHESWNELSTNTGLATNGYTYWAMLQRQVSPVAA